MNACVHNLNWTHIRSLLRVADENARYWYMQAPQKDAVIKEMNQKTARLQKNQFELIKSPVIAEFLGFKNEDAYL